MGLGDTKKLLPPSRTETVKPSRGIDGAGMEVYYRDFAPSHCILEINEFSLKATGEGEIHQSEIFEAGGCKWSLSLYPNGNNKRGGKDHISLYLNIEETDKFTSGWEVFINYKLFVLDQIDDSYLTIQDAQGAVKRFHERKKQWGFAQLLSLETLKDNSNGYLLDDTCIFGAEVYILKLATGKSKSSPTTIKLQSDSNKNEKSSSSTPDDQVDGKDKEKPSYSKTDDQADRKVKEKSSSTIDDPADGNNKEKASSSTTDDQVVRNDKGKSSSFIMDNQVVGNKVVIMPSLPPTSKEGLVMYKRKQPPSDYILKLDNFSLLRGTIYCTDWFKHGGYNWSLTLHPNGNKEDGGEGHISLYLKLEDQNDLPLKWEVFVYCKFFIQDLDKASSYLIIQDAAELGGSFKRYHEHKNEWGIGKLMSLETFNESSNGYLVDDRCVFGVEIFVLKATEKNGILTAGQTLYSPNKITFKLESFSTLGQEKYESIPYRAFGGHKWRLIVYPKKHQGDLIFELHLDGYEQLPKPTTVITKVTMRVLDQLFGKHKEITQAWNGRYRENSSLDHYGFLTSKELYKPENGYLVNDTFIAQVEFHQ